MKQGKKLSLDMLVEGPGGELVFVPLKASKVSVKQMVSESKNPVIRHNVFRPGLKKRVKL